MPRNGGGDRDYGARPWRRAGQVKNMCTGNWLRSSGRSGDTHHQRRDGQCFLRGVIGRKPVCGEEAVEEASVNISVRDVGDAKVVKVEGDVDLGTSKDLRRTLFETLPRAAKLALNLEAIRYIDSSGI